MHFLTTDPQGKLTHWNQTFPTEGGTVLVKEADSRESDLIFTVSSDGAVSGLEEDFSENVPSERRGDSLLFQEPCTPPATVEPAVPLDWIMT